MKKVLVLTPILCVLILMAGCNTTPGGTPLPAWAQTLRADVIVLVADVQAHAAPAQIQADIDKLIADVQVVAPLAKDVKAAAETLIADFQTNATTEKKIQDGIALLAALNKLRA